MRLFFALGLGDCAEVINQQCIAPMRQQLGEESISWTRPENLHITLAFLGELQAEAQKLAQSLARQLTPPSPFPLSLGPVEQFPDAKSRIVALAVEQSPVLLEFQQALASRLAEADLPVDQRRYRPHITLGRIRKWGRVEAGLAWPHCQQDVLVQDFALYRSAPGGRQGSIYEALETYPMLQD